MEAEKIRNMADGDNPQPLLLIEEPGLGCAEEALEAARAWSGQPALDFSNDRLSMSASSSGVSLSEATKLLSLKSDHRRTLVLNLTGAGFEVQNALLKTLEEPPSDTWIILIAESDYPLLATVSSRCRVIQAEPLSDEQLKEWAHAQGLSLSDDLVKGASGNRSRLTWLAENLEIVDAFEKADYGVILASMQQQDDAACWVDSLLGVLQGLNPERDLSEPRVMASSGVRPELVLARLFLGESSLSF